MNNTTASTVFKVCHMSLVRFRIVVAIPSTSYIVNHVAVCLVSAILVLSTIFLNAITLITFWKSSQLRRKVCYMLIIIQSSVDLGPGALGTAFYTAHVASEITGTASCAFFLWMRMSSFVILFLTMANLSVMNIERYFGIVHPIIHTNSLTRQKLLMCIACIYSLCILALIMSVFIRSVGTVCVAIIVIFLAITVYCYLGIYLTATFFRRAVHPAEAARNNLNSSPGTNISESSRKRQFLKNIKLAKSCFLLVVCLFCCFLPTVVTLFVRSRSFGNTAFKRWAAAALWLNSSLNSVIFFWRNPVLRNEAKAVLKSMYRS